MAKQPPVTEAEIAMFKHLAAKGMTRPEISEHTGRSMRTLDRFLKPGDLKRAKYDRTKHLAAYMAAQAARVEIDRHGLHLKSIAAANNGYGFPVVTSPRIDQINAYERPLPRKREFWRAA